MPAITETVVAVSCSGSMPLVAGRKRSRRRSKQRSLPFVRGAPVPREQLASLLVTPDAHLITLSDAFVGFVLPSKVHGCIASGRQVLFIGSAASDVHRLCTERMRVPYRRDRCGRRRGLRPRCARADGAVEVSVRHAAQRSSGREQVE